MKKSKLTTKVWAVLAAVNVLALIYPISVLHYSVSTDEALVADFLLIAFVFLLAVVDAVSIATVDVAPRGKRRPANKFREMKAFGLVSEFQLRG